MKKSKVLAAELVPEAEEKVDNIMALANSKPLAENMLATIQNHQIVKKEDLKFLQENKQHLQAVCEKTFIWRTKQQKLSIIHDAYHPTLASKFHQAILEQKVFFEQMVELNKQAEKLKFELEDILLDAEEIEGFMAKGVWEKPDGHTVACHPGSINYRRLDRKLRELQLEQQYKSFQLQQCAVAMNYRIREIRDWKDIQNALIEKMKAAPYNMTDEQIWDKEAGEAETHFFLFLNNYQNVHQSKDSGEIQNLTALARHGIDQAIALGKFQEWTRRCNNNQIKSLLELGYAKIVQDSQGQKLEIMMPENLENTPAEMYDKVQKAKDLAIAAPDLEQ